MATASLSRAGKVYVGIVVAAGALPITSSLLQISSDPPSYHWVILAALTFFSGPFAIRVPSLHARISVSETFVFASALLFGPAPATLTVALDGVIVSLWSRQRTTYRTLFNIAEPAISVWASAQLFYLMAGVPPLFNQPVAIGELLLPLLALTTTYFLLNSWLTALAVWFETELSPVRFLRNHLPHLSLNYSMSVCLVALLVQHSDDINFAAVGVILPLLVVSYFSSKMSMARVEDANRHLADLNTLYLSTVETLAMAVDAKDQVTHGHIRRVQRRAVALAKALGVKEESQIKGIKAAALLHDLGKLAVPEHILKKPGTLTPVEFEQMKAHASVGAHILSRIDFPYPVAPIVRHHHERWDGSGYPDGLQGETIPLAARILSVVDCFDALTSDRPYRRRYSEQEAIDFLWSRRGTMYDPRVVDTFLQTYKIMITPLEEAESGEQETFAEIVSPPLVRARDVPMTPAEPPLRRDRTHQLEVDLPDLMALRGESSLERTGRAIAHYLKTVTPGSVCTVYRYEPSTGHLVASYVSSEQHRFLGDVRIPLGERVTGWVGANHQTIVNSDPALDLGDLVGACKPRFRTCLSTALVRNGALVGVLTLYSPNRKGFGDEQIRIVEALAAAVVEPVAMRTPA